MFLALIHRTEHHKWTIGIVISIIVLALGLFLYMQNEGEDVGVVKEGTGATSSILAVADVQGEPMVVAGDQGQQPFILAIIPGDAVLDGGSYRAPVGSILQIRARVMNAEGGVLYFKPKDSKQIEVQESEKIGELVSSADLPGEYVAPFEVKKDMSGLLIVVMHGKDGQTAQLSVNVASK